MSVTVEKCLQAWTKSLKQMNAKADIVFFGDSLTYYGDFASVFPDKVVCNLGLRGDTIQGMIDRVEQVKVLQPKVVFLMAGINDIMSFGLKEFSKQYEGLVVKLSRQLFGLELIVQLMLPVNDRDFPINCNTKQIIIYNKEIVGISKKYKFKLIDLFSLYLVDGVLPKEETDDGIHLKKEKYKKWYDTLKAFV